MYGAILLFLILLTHKLIIILKQTPPYNRKQCASNDANFMEGDVSDQFNNNKISHTNEFQKL